jgi:hypothetical protein
MFMILTILLHIFAGKAAADPIDHKKEYVTSLLLLGLLDQVQRDCVRENDGPMLMCLWKMNIIQFHNRNHHKYVILAHRLLAGINILLKINWIYRYQDLYTLMYVLGRGCYLMHGI